MNREPSFPFDWIQPEEFRYCNCGWFLIPKEAARCAKCSLSRHKENRVKFDKECQQTHQQLLKERDELANKRKAEGLSPLFWMEK